MKQSRPATLNTICERDHFVQYYQHDVQLIKDLASFVGGGILAGDACIIIATTQHAEALIKLLLRDGIDMAATEICVAMDAQTTLALIMKDGLPNRDKFGNLAIERLNPHIKDGKCIRIFSEMSAILWEQGEQNSSKLLESFCGEIMSHYNMTVFCAYPLHHFEGSDQTIMIQEISQLHSSYILQEAHVVVR